MAGKLADFGALWPAERRLADWIGAGNREPCEISPGLPPGDAPREVRLRASFLRALALGGFEDCRISEKGLGVFGASVEGDGPEAAETRGLDLAGCTLGTDLALVACRFPDPVLLRGAALRSLFLNRSALMQGLGADGLEATGDVVLRGVAAEGEVRLLGARLGGGLDATGARFAGRKGEFAFSADGLEAKGGVVLRGVAAEGAVRLPGAKLGGDLDATGARFTGREGEVAFGADGLEAKGGVVLDGVAAEGAVRLLGAKLGGDLSATGARFAGREGEDAFGADGLEAKGSVFLDGVAAEGAVRLVGAKLGGNLDATGARFTGRGDRPAFSADGLEAKGSVFLDGVAAEGAVRLLGAKLGGNLSATGACFTGRGDRPAFNADRLEAKGSVFLSGVAAEGLVRLPGAKLGGDLDLEGVTLSPGADGRALSLDGANVKGSLFLRAGAKVSGTLSLANVEIGTLVDDEASWPRRLILDRCRYGGFAGGAPVSAAARIRWLSLQEGASADGEFRPQPWQECARALREAGHGAAAREVLVEKEKRQRAAGRARIVAAFGKARAARAIGLSLRLSLRLVFQTLWDRTLGAVIGYGRRPGRAAIWGLGFLLVGWLIFAAAEGHGALKPNLPQLQRAPEWVLCGVDEDVERELPSLGRVARGLRRAEETQYGCFLRQEEARAYPRFNALVYSADTLIPVVALEMQSYWLPDDGSARGRWTRVYLWVHILAGWGLTLLAVAGFSGLVKQDSS